MTTEEMERAIGFLLDHHAKVSADIERHSEQIGKLTETVSTLSGDVQMLAQVVEADRRATSETLDRIITEIQDGFNKLILGNELTRDLANKVASLEVQTSQRVTNLEQRVTDLESK